MKHRLILFGIFISTAIPLRAEEPAVDGLACIETVKRVCVGLEDKLEQCLSERSNQFTEPCKEQLRYFTSVVQTQTGPAVCLPDVQKACPGMQVAQLYSCIQDKKTTFSEACQDYLAHTPEMASHHH